jgi:hypothetical protein
VTINEEESKVAEAGQNERRIFSPKTNPSSDDLIAEAAVVHSKNVRELRRERERERTL